jgi:inorganic pyrophosphatase
MQIPIGEHYPEIINAVVEIPRGSHQKYEYDEHLDEIRLDRILHSPLFYPVDYGFIPETRSEDGDHLDVLILVSEPLFSGCLVEVRPIGALDMADQAGQDWKIVAVAVKDPRQENIRSIQDVDEHYRKEIQHFFEVYKHLENKWVEVRGWHDTDEAHRLIKDAYLRFSKEQSKR